MGKSKKNRAASTKQIQHKSQTSAEAFSFGDPVPVLDRRELLDYVECVQMDRWYDLSKDDPQSIMRFHAA
ncbi:hypothetical protein FSG13_000515 [Escherichia coli]|nr:hypothetical protein [Escherichia coli]